jgi:hypothetical protein
VSLDSAVIESLFVNMSQVSLPTAIHGWFTSSATGGWNSAWGFFKKRLALFNNYLSTVFLHMGKMLLFDTADGLTRVPNLG